MYQHILFHHLLLSLLSRVLNIVNAHEHKLLTMWQHMNVVKNFSFFRQKQELLSGLCPKQYLRQVVLLFVTVWMMQGRLELEGFIPPLNANWFGKALNVVD